MQFRSPFKPVRRSVRSRVISSIFGLLLFAPPGAHAQEGDPSQQGVVSSPRTTKVHPLLNLPLVYVSQGGAELDGYHIYTFSSRRMAHLPKLSDSLGIRPSAGVLIEQMLHGFSMSAAVSLEYTKHRAISYNVGSSWYEHDKTQLYNLGIEVRGYLDVGRFKPFVGIAPGYGWLKMPNGVTFTSADPLTGYPYNVSWLDVTLRGLSFEASAGLLYEIVPFLSADASFTYRLQGFSSSSQGSLHGLGYSPALIASLGVLLKI